MITYIVSAEFESAHVMKEWCAWLKREHIKDVCKAGADSGQCLTSVDTNNVLCAQAHYTFSDHEAFENYLQHGAPKLRKEGLKLFPLSLGINYQRFVMQANDEKNS